MNLEGLIELASRHFSQHERPQVARPMDGLVLLRQDTPSAFEASLYEPVLRLILQGRKQVSEGRPSKADPASTTRQRPRPADATGGSSRVRLRRALHLDGSLNPSRWGRKRPHERFRTSLVPQAFVLHPSSSILTLARLCAAVTTVALATAEPPPPAGFGSGRRKVHAKAAKHAKTSCLRWPASARISFFEGVLRPSFGAPGGRLRGLCVKNPAAAQAIPPAGRRSRPLQLWFSTTRPPLAMCLRASATLSW